MAGDPPGEGSTRDFGPTDVMASEEVRLEEVSNDQKYSVHPLIGRRRLVYRSCGRGLVEILRAGQDCRREGAPVRSRTGRPVAGGRKGDSDLRRSDRSLVDSGRA
ncbi:protein of unknown function [Nitrospira japonica]|uniref:Uncharacterized protein n=1 Tax=Nitrospira japonica TaxID=1325564 RepID=A0A1W1I044_9BACT|nr:protein of unknown function [Nitrospira japonica]